MPRNFFTTWLAKLLLFFRSNFIDYYYLHFYWTSKQILTYTFIQTYTFINIFKVSVLHFYSAHHLYSELKSRNFVARTLLFFHQSTLFWTNHETTHTQKFLTASEHFPTHFWLIETVMLLKFSKWICKYSGTLI